MSEKRKRNILTTVSKQLNSNKVVRFIASLMVVIAFFTLFAALWNIFGKTTIAIVLIPIAISAAGVFLWNAVNEHLD